MDGTIQRWGNSQAVRLPKGALETARFKENESVRIVAELDRIIIERAPDKKHRKLKDRLAGFNDDYDYKEWDTGAPVGSEVL